MTDPGDSTRRFVGELVRLRQLNADQPASRDVGRIIAFRDDNKQARVKWSDGTTSWYSTSLLERNAVTPATEETSGATKIRTRDDRQARIAAWCVEAFGAEEASSLPQRAVRLAEEAVELAQACGCDPAMLRRLIDHVYSRPAGEVGQELGGVGVTTLALAHAAGLSADAEEEAEVNRVLQKETSYFRSRNQAKNDAGFLAISSTPSAQHDPIHPQHYKSHPSGVECIDVIEPMSFNVGTAIKYLWRAGLKTPDPLEDLRKARWYVSREIQRLARRPA